MNEASLINVYNRLVFGKFKNNYTISDLRNDFTSLNPPVIFLSTGRCGTLWLTELINASKNCFGIHHPNPVMRSQATLAYQYNFATASKDEQILLQELFLAGREEVLVKCQRSEKKAIITDSRGTFFAEIIAELFPQAKFVFLHRHPGEVIRSGVNRGWYKTQDDSHLNRITPRKNDPFFAKWQQASLIEKNAWQWDATNSWILNFLKNIPKENQHAIRFNDWNKISISNLMEFVGATNSIPLIEKKLNQKSNSMKGAAVLPKYKDWSTDKKNEVIAICKQTAEILNYQL